LQPVAPAEPSASANRIEYRRAGITEWYLNGAGGLERGFTLPQPPGAPQPGQPLVSSPDEELISCCSCLLTPDQVVDLGVNRDILPNNTHSGQIITSVTVTLLGTLAGDTGNGTSCAESAAAATSASIVGGFVAFRTTLHAAAGGAPYAVTEVPFLPASLSTAELASLGNRCTAIIGNLSGYGICAACRPGAEPPSSRSCGKGARSLARQGASTVAVRGEGFTRGAR